MTARVATIAVLRMYLRVMNDGWVRGVGSCTGMDGNKDRFCYFCCCSTINTSAAYLLGDSDDDGDDRH